MALLCEMNCTLESYFHRNLEMSAFRHFTSNKCKFRIMNFIALTRFMRLFCKYLEYLKDETVESKLKNLYTC